MGIIKAFNDKAKIVRDKYYYVRENGGGYRVPVDPNEKFNIYYPHITIDYSKIPEENVIPHVDVWEPAEEDKIFRAVNRGKITAPVSRVLIDEDDMMFDEFVLAMKKSYSAEAFTEHVVHYLNYLEKYYDENHELLVIYAKIKYMIDTMPEYNEQNLMDDIKRDIIFGSFHHKIKAMNEANFIIHIKKNKRDGNVLQYNNAHLLALMEISLFQVTMIPLIMHFTFRRKVNDIDAFLSRCYDVLIRMHDDMNLLNKLIETANSRIIQNYSKNQVLWDKQFIRGRNRLVQNIETVMSIITVIIPKFKYEENILNLIYTTVKFNITCKVISAKYEYAFKQLSSDRNEGDEDNNSEFDKFESHLSKKNEALLMHNQVNFSTTMKKIEDRFGPFTDEEVYYYKVELCKGKKSPIVPLQKTLVSYLFYRYFGDPDALGSIDFTNYVKLIIAAKRILAANNLHTMEAIISGKFVKVINRTNINKKELTKITSSNTYKAVASIYRNEKITNLLIGLLATILSSKFQIIDFENKEETGKPFIPQQELLNEEFLLYVSLINK